MDVYAAKFSERITFAGTAELFNVLALAQNEHMASRMWPAVYGRAAILNAFEIGTFKRLSL